jgi:hypothetical protein
MQMKLTRAPLPRRWVSEAAFDDERVGLVPLDVLVLEELEAAFDDERVGLIPLDVLVLEELVVVGCGVC